MTTDHIPNDGIDWATAEDAYHIIRGLLDQVQAANGVIAVMAGVLGPATTQQITESAAWADYMTRRRMMEPLQAQIKKFTETMAELAKSRPDRPEEENDEV